MIDDMITKMPREQLYNQIWEISASGVAKKYDVPYAELLKLCKATDIPIPPSGYWIKLNYGKGATKIPLPDSLISEVMLPSKHVGEKRKKALLPKTNEGDVRIKTKPTEKVNANVAAPQQLRFLTEEERKKVLVAAEQIKLADESVQIHKKTTTYNSVVKEWNKKNIVSEGSQRSIKSYSKRPPFLAGVISNATLPRVYRILDSLFRQVELLGGSVNDDLSLQVRNECVCLDIVETQDEIPHVITRKEAQELLVYEDAKRHSSWASKPQIRKYEYVFNGQLRICIRQSRYFRDTDSIKVESKLGDMLIELFEESEVVRIDREASEEAVRKHEEEARQREERRNRYNSEIENLIALENETRDYEKACKIRSYVDAVVTAGSQDGLDDATARWVEWAKNKSDWFDPTISKNDDIFGK